MVAAVAGQQPRWASQHITAQPSFRVATARQQCITRSTSQLSSISAAAPAPTEPYTYTSSRYSATVRPRSTSAHIASQSTVGRIHATNDVVLTGKRCESAVPNAIATTTTTTATVGVADAVLCDGVRLHSAYSSRTSWRMRPRRSRTGIAANARAGQLAALLPADGATLLVSVASCSSCDIST